jgi:dTDP-glucose pyrophosphorylase
MKNSLVKKCTLKHTSSIRDAINSLIQTSQRIIFVTMNSNNFLGTVADGDIRRGLISGLTLNDPINLITNKKPIITNKEIHEIKVARLMKKKDINHIPLIQKKKIISVYSKDEKKKIPEKKNVFLIMAGGFGKRLLPLTKITPKPMIKIDKKPIIENIILNAKKYGFTNIYISVHYLKKKIIDYFKDGKNLGVNIKYIVEKKPLGTAGCLGLINNTNLPMVICNGDIVSEINFEDLLKFHIKNKTDASIVIKYIEDVSSFGIVETKKNFITNFVEKPKKSLLVNSGVYIVNNKIRKYIKGKIDMSEFLKSMIKKKKKIAGYLLYEKWVDIGSKNILKNFKKKSKIN